MIHSADPGRTRVDLVRDAAMWLVLAVSGVVWYLDSRGSSSLWLDLLLPLLVLAVAVPLSRRWPVVALGLANLLTVAGLLHPTSPANPYVLALALFSYLLGTRSSDYVRALVSFGACLAVDLALCAVLQTGILAWFYMTAVVPVALLLPWLVGRYRRARLELVRGGWERAESLEEQQRVVEEQARLRERARIAADMHDSLGHALSLIALRAGALQVAPTLTEKDRAAVRELRAATSDAVEHLRETIGVLRDGFEVTSAPSDETVEALVERSRASNMAVELVRTGRSEGLSPQVDRAVYRIVQEGLTNATKHAPGAGVHVVITHEDDETTVRVVNDPPPAGPLPGLTPGNRGLIGLRERVDLVGGALRAGPHEGGFEIVATVPDKPARNRTEQVGQERGTPASESARQLVRGRRRVQLRFLLAFTAPVVVGTGMAAAAVYFAYQMFTCVLRPSDYEAVQLGRERSEIVSVLPRQQFRHVSSQMRAVPRPAGATCEFYRSNSNPFEDVDVYRLCYAGGAVVAKDVLYGSHE